MRLPLCLALLTAGLHAHTSWKPAAAEVAAEGSRVTVELRLDLPALLVGKTPAEARDEEMDAALASDGRLAESLALLRPGWDGRLRMRVDGRLVDLRVTRAPDVDSVRAEQRALKIGEAYPLMQSVQLEGEWPAGASTFELATDPLLGPVVLRLRLEPGRLDFLQLPAGGGTGALALGGTPVGPAGTASGFFARGFGHVIPDGWDHALFMLTLFLGAESLRRAFARSVAFTLGHTSTIALVWLGWIASPGPWIEPLIALSIAVAAAAVALGRSVPGQAALGWALGFGLLHGLGFAAVADMPDGGGLSLLAALLGFNFGVEAAQLAVMLAAGLVLAPFRAAAWYEARLRRPLAALATLGGLALLASRI